MTDRYQNVVDFLHPLANVKRIELLFLLSEGEMTVTDLVKKKCRFEKHTSPNALLFCVTTGWLHFSKRVGMCITSLPTSKLLILLKPFRKYKENLERSSDTANPIRRLTHPNYGHI